MSHAELLLRAPLFAAMPRGVVAELAARAVQRKIRRGQRVIARGDAALVMLVTGRIELVGGGVVIRSLMPPAIAGVSLAIGAEPSAELRAAEDCAILVVPATAVAGALRRHPEVAFAAITHLASVIAELSAEIEALRRHGLVERIRYRLAQLGRGRREIAITHAALADEVGGSRANVSRALARLEREGALHRRRGVITLGTR